MRETMGTVDGSINTMIQYLLFGLKVIISITKWDLVPV